MYGYLVTLGTSVLLKKLADALDWTFLALSD